MSENIKVNAWEAAEEIVNLQRENAALRNEIARLNSQTNWVCKCGGTDCEGQKENAALRADKERLDSGMIRLRSDNGWGMVWCIYKGMDLRAAIDAARKEEQP